MNYNLKASYTFYNKLLWNKKELTELLKIRRKHCHSARVEKSRLSFVLNSSTGLNSLYRPGVWFCFIQIGVHRILIFDSHLRLRLTSINLTLRIRAVRLILFCNIKKIFIRFQLNFRIQLYKNNLTEKIAHVCFHIVYKTRKTLKKILLCTYLNFMLLLD